MKHLEGRLSRLEERHGLARNKPAYLVLLRDHDGELTPEEKAYIERLSKEGRFHSGCFTAVSLLGIPKEPTPKPTADRGPIVTVKLNGYTLRMQRENAAKSCGENNSAA